MVPAPFRSLRVLRGLNIAGVGLSLAALTSVVLGQLGGGDETLGLSAFVTGLPTLLVGMFWARLLRWRRTVGKSTVRLGWVLSIPLAMLNASLAAGIMLGAEQNRLEGYLGGMFAGATFGAMVWIPALLATLLLFGVPIAWSQRQAEQGLAGEERGEGIVGLVIAALSVLALGILARTGSVGIYDPSHKWAELAQVGQSMEYIYGSGGLLTGGLACYLAWSRERQRRQIVRGAEAGELTGFRVDTTEAGKVLVRVTAQGEGYRVTDLDEELFALDQQGRAVQTLAAREMSAPGSVER